MPAVSNTAIATDATVEPAGGCSFPASRLAARILIALAAPLPIAAPLWAQDLEAAADDAVELVTDRPDFTESAVVVGRGSLQLESGMSWQRQGSSRTAVSGPEALLRWGVARRLELRLALPDYVHTDDRSGLGDAAVGLKAQLGPLRSGWDLAGIAAVSLPTGEDEFSSDGSDPSLVVTAGRPLSPRWTFGGQLSVGWPTIAVEGVRMRRYRSPRSRPHPLPVQLSGGGHDSS